MSRRAAAAAAGITSTTGPAAEGSAAAPVLGKAIPITNENEKEAATLYPRSRRLPPLLSRLPRLPLPPLPPRRQPLLLPLRLRPPQRPLPPLHRLPPPPLLRPLLPRSPRRRAAFSLRAAVAEVSRIRLFVRQSKMNNVNHWLDCPWQAILPLPLGQRPSRYPCACQHGRLTQLTRRGEARD